MLARYLKVGEAIELLAAIVLARALVLAGLEPWLAIALAALLPFAVHGVPLGIEFVTGALIDRRPVARIGFFQLVRVWQGGRHREPAGVPGSQRATTGRR